MSCMRKEGDKVLIHLKLLRDEFRTVVSKDLVTNDNCGNLLGISVSNRISVGVYSGPFAVL